MQRKITWAGWAIAILAVICLTVVLIERGSNEPSAPPVVASAVTVAPTSADKASPADSNKEWQSAPRAAPYRAIRWQGKTAQVQIDGNWYELQAINDVSTDSIVAFSESIAEDKWQKHFEEDLVELMTRMGHQPRNTVSLSLKDSSGKDVMLKDVPMTEENRDALREARAKQQQQM